MATYLTYPFKTMTITQSYTGSTSHYPHTKGNYRDYPIDEAGADYGRDPFYAPCRLKVVRIYGVGNGGTNTVWLESTEKVKLANGKTDYVTIMLIHPNDSDLRRLYVGQTFNKGDIVCYEGTDGATGNHIHMSVGMGTMTCGGWVQNSYGKWVLSTSHGTIRPEEAFFIDPKFTKIKQTKGIVFKKLPTGKAGIKYTAGDYKVVKVGGAGVLRLRKGPAKTYGKVKFSEMTKSAQEKILRLAGKKVNGYVKGLTFTALEVKGNWGRTPSGWVNLTYCERV